MNQENEKLKKELNSKKLVGWRNKETQLVILSLVLMFVFILRQDGSPVVNIGGAIVCALTAFGFIMVIETQARLRQQITKLVNVLASTQLKTQVEFKTAELIVVVIENNLSGHASVVSSEIDITHRDLGHRIADMVKRAENK